METLLRISDAATLGLHAMAFIARHGGDHAVSVQHMAEALQVSDAHLGKVLQRLARVNLVRSRRGPKGGFRLGREPERVRLLEIYEAIDGPLGDADCLLSRGSCVMGACIMGTLLSDVRKLVQDQLGGTTLADIAGTPVGADAPARRLRRPLCSRVLRAPLDRDLPRTTSTRPPGTEPTASD